MIKKEWLFLLLLAACKGKAPNHNLVKQDSLLYYPYQAIYSEDFEKGNPYYTEKVLQCWKELENGNILKRSADFSDSIRIILPERILSGEKETVLNELKKRRDAYSDVQFYVDAWMPLKAKDAGEDIVLLWGRQDCKKKDGKRDYLVLHEIWRFDRKGRIRQMQQYITHPF